MRAADFAFRIDDIKNADINDPSTWPVSLKMLLILVGAGAILFAGYWYIIKDQILELETREQKEQSLKATFIEKKKLAINLPAYKKQMEEIRQRFGLLLQQLPNKTEVPELLIDITQAGLGQGLKFNLFDPGNKSVKDFYAVLPIKINATGTYHQYGDFISELSTLSRIVTVGNVKITRKGDSLNMAAVLNTYHYLDEGSTGSVIKKKGPKSRARR
ncbi:MAG TPA: pilus assembly protein PilO [Gammaproteobacteria bacterium]|nr:Pilus assembly protein, PilO [bacterium BMS3Abin11]GMT39944.1 MAG: pilus assembly protein PilP [bacterium]HDH08469.1 pilus assembly protein PilO [Gammaproteobacteria bacterium]HDH15285.1 pilus assembly protein PilO [Gammaproteobacteria bacterium]HDZ78141.1 pilus assembly protein PilO [Gammaproteobacteria bacterium]